MNGDDSRYMARAIELAARGLYTTDPNPRVGCVLVRDAERMRATYSFVPTYLSMVEDDDFVEMVLRTEAMEIRCERAVSK